MPTSPTPKHEWRKAEKALYLPGKNPVRLQVPPMTFIEIDGQGNPNEEAFSRNVGALYSASYTLRMMPRNGFTPQGYYEYGVYPLEALWTLSQPWLPGSGPLPKDKLVYRLMIRQPDFCTAEVYARVLEMAARKIEPDLLPRLRLSRVEDGDSIQMMHLGPYDDEPESFARMAEYAAASGCVRRGMEHREIYLSDPRKTAPEKNRTVLREFVADA